MNNETDNVLPIFPAIPSVRVVTFNESVKSLLLQNFTLPNILDIFEKRIRYEQAPPKNENGANFWEYELRTCKIKLYCTIASNGNNKEKVQITKIEFTNYLL